MSCFCHLYLQQLVIEKGNFDILLSERQFFILVEMDKKLEQQLKCRFLCLILSVLKIKHF